MSYRFATPMEVGNAMVSRQLVNFSEFFAAWGALPQATLMEPRTATLLAAEFAALADQVAALEDQPVPPPLRGTLPAGIARLDVARDQRRAGRPVTGGAAA